MTAIVRRHPFARLSLALVAFAALVLAFGPAARAADAAPANSGTYSGSYSAATGLTTCTAAAATLSRWQTPPLWTG